MGDAKGVEGKSTDQSGTDPSRQAGGVISFHCTNGHHIKVAARLAGKRGACTKCGVDVVIPAAPAALPPSPPPAVKAPAAPPPPARPPAPAARSGNDASALDALFEAVGGPARPEEENTIMMHAPPREWAAPDADQPVNPTARLVARLWAEREHGGIVELHVSGGSVILPEWYEPHWSSGSHGLFASQAADGSVTLTAVSWDSIQKIVVRQVEGLPDGMFE